MREARWFDLRAASGIRNAASARGGGGTGAGPEILALLLAVWIPLLPLGLAHASGGGEASTGWPGFFWKLLNFAVIAGLLYWLTAQKVRDFFRERRERIKGSLAAAAADREAAERKFRDYSARLEQATAEIDEIVRTIRDQGLAEKERIVDEARKAAEKMKEEARMRMEQEFGRATLRLKTEAVRLSAELAEDLLRENIRQQDHDAMVRQTIDQVVRNR